MPITRSSNRRLFKTNSGKVFIDTQRWNTGAAIVGTRYTPSNTRQGRALRKIDELCSL